MIIEYEEIRIDIRNGTTKQLNKKIECGTNENLKDKLENKKNIHNMNPSRRTDIVGFVFKKEE